MYARVKQFRLDIRREERCPNCGKTSVENHLLQLSIADVVAGSTGAWSCQPAPDPEAMKPIVQAPAPEGIDEVVPHTTLETEPVVVAQPCLQDPCVCSFHCVKLELPVSETPVEAPLDQTSTMPAQVSGVAEPVVEAP